MKRWSIPLMVAAIALLLPAFPGDVSAQEGAALSIKKSADKTPVGLGDTITYTLTVANTGNVTVDNITLSDYKLWTPPRSIGSLAPGDNVTVPGNYTVLVADFPGPIINTANVTGTAPNGDSVSAIASATVELNPYAAGIEVTKAADKTTASPHETVTYSYTITNTGDVTIDNLVSQDDKLGEIDLGATASLGPGESMTAAAEYEVVIDDLPGPIVNVATAEGKDPLGNPVSAESNSVSVSLNKSLMTKAEILKLSGVPGKGIDTAPGLQKPFNPKSQAAEHAGKKNHADDEEATPDDGQGKAKMNKQLKIRTRVENQAGDDQATREQLKTRTRVENQAGNDEATDDKGKGKPKKK